MRSPDPLLEIILTTMGLMGLSFCVAWVFWDIREAIRMRRGPGFIRTVGLAVAWIFTIIGTFGPLYVAIHRLFEYWGI